MFQKEKLLHVANNARKNIGLMNNYSETYFVHGNKSINCTAVSYCMKWKIGHEWDESFTLKAI